MNLSMIAAFLSCSEGVTISERSIFNQLFQVLMNEVTLLLEAGFSTSVTFTGSVSAFGLVFSLSVTSSVAEIFSSS